MPRFISLLLALIQLTVPADASAVAAIGMKTGVTLRMHVIAPDDTPEMQQLKLQVRDEVRSTYAELTAGASYPMLVQTARFLPELTASARDAAAASGYSGEVTVTLALQEFGDRTLDGLTIPAGRYPALIIRLGPALGQNWWGLIDSRLAVACSAIDGETEQPVIWDWSLQGFLDALLSMFSRPVFQGRCPS